MLGGKRMKPSWEKVRIAVFGVFGTSIFAIILIAIPTLARAQPATSVWPMFHHDLRHTGLSTVDTSANPGSLKWVFNESIGTAFISSPAIGTDGTIYFGSQNHKFYALNPDGKRKWAFEANSIVDSSPAVALDGTIYAADENATLYALKPNGKKKWTYESNGTVIYTPTIGPDGTIYVGTALTLDALTDNGTYGSTKWSFRLGDDPLTAPAIGADGTIYVGCADNNLYAINPDGTLKWKFATGDRVNSSPAIGADGTIYFGSDDFNLYAVTDGGQGTVTEKWAFTTGAKVESSPAIGADGTIYFGSYDFNLYALTDGGRGIVTEKWAFAAGLITFTAPAISADGTIYACTDSGVLYAVNPDGSQKWAFTAGGPLGSSSPVIGPDGTIYVGGETSKLYAVGTTVRVKLRINPSLVNFGRWKVGTILLPGVCDFSSLQSKVGLSTDPCVVVSNPIGSKMKPGITVRMQGISGANSPFIAANGCIGPLAAGAQCVISIGFAPTAVGLAKSTLMIFDDAEDAPQSVKLTGYGK